MSQTRLRGVCHLTFSRVCRRGYFAAVLLSALSIQACTLARLQIRDPLPTTPQPAPSACEVRYSLSLYEVYRTNTAGTHVIVDKRLEDDRAKYVRATNEALHEAGCAGTLEISPSQEVDLQVAIHAQPNLSAAPQEWLTGLSGGLIPSWATVESQYQFRFTDTRGSHSYAIDEKRLSHLVLAPVCWMTFKTADPYRIYKAAVRNFLARRT
jgi:hypothetical protein